MLSIVGGRSCSINFPGTPGMGLVTSFNVMTLASSNIDQEYGFRVFLARAVEENFIYRKVSEPVLTRLKRTCHEGIEVAHHWWVFDKPLEHTVRSVVSILERTRSAIHVLEARGFQVFRHVS